MVFKEIAKEDGYTIAELLLALTIVSVVLTTVGSVFIFINQQMNTWSSNLSSYNNYQIVQNKLFNDVLRAESITATDTLLALEGVQKTSTYSWGKGNLRYNSVSLTTSEVDSVLFEISSNPLNPKVYVWALKQKTGTKEMGQDFIIHLRKPVQWEPFVKSRDSN